MEYQQSAFDKLVRIGRAAEASNRYCIPIKQRTSSLIVGGSGCGKTFLASAVARHLSAPCLILSTAEWVPLGANNRGSGPTWKHIARFLLTASSIPGSPQSKPPLLIIFVDEICKLTGTGDWNGYLVCELLGLLDKRLPLGIKDEDDDEYSPKQIGQIQEALSNRTLILAAGAFQHIWENQYKVRVGFGSEPQIAADPNTSQLVETLPRELINRFRSDLVILNQPQRGDYQDMLLRSAEVLPQEMQNGFLQLGETQIDQAIESRSGFRFVEELLMDFLIDWESQPNLDRKNLAKARKTRLRFFNPKVEQFPPEDPKASGK